MMCLSRIDLIASRLISARGGGLLADESLKPGPVDRSEAYGVQSAVASQVGRVGAFKTGRKSPDEQPIMAPIFAGDVRPSPAQFAPIELHVIGIELEVAFLLRRALPPVDSTDFVARARACVSPLAAIEVVDTRLADREAAGLLWQLADNQSNGGLVVGTAVDDWAGRDLVSIEARLEIGGDMVIDGPTEVPGGDAYETFCAFARLVGSHCGGLTVGQYVTTGSVSGLMFIERGRTVTGRISGLGTVTVEFPTH